MPDRTAPCRHARAQEIRPFRHVCPQCGMGWNSGKLYSLTVERATWEDFRAARIAAGLPVTKEPGEMAEGLWRREG